MPAEAAGNGTGPRQLAQTDLRSAATPSCKLAIHGKQATSTATCLAGLLTRADPAFVAVAGPASYLTDSLAVSIEAMYNWAIQFAVHLL